MKYELIIGLNNEDMDINTMITSNNTVVTDATSEILGNEIIIRDVLDLCDERRDLKKWFEVEGAKEYRGFRMQRRKQRLTG